jgi:putative ABC transport system permease protein
MLKSHLKSALRSIIKNKFYTFISVSGLAIGLTAAILILLWCQDERSYNRSVKGSENIYRAVPSFGPKGSQWYFPTVPPALATVTKEAPGVEKVGRIFPNWDEMVLSYKEKTFSEKHSAYADPALFDLLDLPFVEGNRQNPFRDKHSIVLTEPFAKKYFGNEDPIGKVITRKDKKENFTVTGIVKAVHNSQMNYDYFLPLNILNDTTGGRNGIDRDWLDYDFETYVKINPGASTASIAANLTRLQKASTTDDLTKTLEYSLQPLAKVHLYNADGSDGPITMVRIFTWVAIVILLIATINYINLTTAKAAQRAKEIGVRKVIGAAKRQLFFQFISETAIVFGIAMIFAAGLIVTLLPLYNSITGKELALNSGDPTIWKVIGVAMAATLIASAVYPAILLSSFKPLQAIKGKFSIGRGNHLLRKVLVVGQFSASVIFILCTLVIGKQLNYVREKNLGIDKENVFRFDLKHMYGKYDLVKTELLKAPSIIAVTAAGQDPLQVNSNTTNNDWPGKDPNKTFLISTLPIERDFLTTMHLKLKEGQGFDGTTADSGHYLLNEAAVKEMGLKEPVGKSFTLFGKKGIIAGIVQDFHFKNMHQKIGPCVLLWRPEWMGQVYVKAAAGHTPEAIAAVNNLWKTYNPEYPFSCNFLDDAYNKMYETDQRTGSLFKIFAVIAIFISCLGLFGLITYAAQLKTREIGIRKVLGATVTSVTGLLAKEFMALVGLAILIASPIGWYFMDRWLQDFAYSIAIPFYIFPVAAASSLAIAAMTISFQAIKAALANPVKSLRSE